MSRRALVTGGGGFIGSHLTLALQRDGWQVVVLDRLPIEDLQNLRALGASPEVRVADLSDPRTLADWEGPLPDAVFHMAANANVARSVEIPLQDFDDTLRTTLHVLLFAKERGIPKVVFPSSACVYSPGVPMPIREDSLVRASSPYGAAKIAGENYCFGFHGCYGTDVTVLRFFNIYGPLMSRFAIHDIVRKLQRDPKRLEIIGDGGQIREYLHVSDAARALILAAEKGGPGKVYNAGSGEPTTILDVARSVVETMGLADVDFTFTMQSWKGDVRAWYADTTRFAELGFQSAVPWKEGLRQTVDYLLEMGPSSRPGVGT